VGRTQPDMVQLGEGGERKRQVRRPAWHQDYEVETAGARPGRRPVATDFWPDTETPRRGVQLGGVRPGFQRRIGESQEFLDSPPIRAAGQVEGATRHGLQGGFREIQGDQDQVEEEGDTHNEEEGITEEVEDDGEDQLTEDAAAVAGTLASTAEVLTDSEEEEEIASQELRSRLARLRSESPVEVDEVSSQELREGLARLRSVSPGGLGGEEREEGDQERGPAQQEIEAGVGVQETDGQQGRPVEELQEDGHTQEIERTITRWRDRGGTGEGQMEEPQQRGEEEGESEEEEDEDNGEEEETGEMNVGEEYGELGDRVSPELPGPRVTQPGEETGDGWHQIDQLGALECFLSRFSTVKEVPGPYEAAWTLAWATVLQREAAAESDLAKERALKWLCFLSQGLLRTPRRGSRAGKGAVAKRFRAVVQGNWGSLVTMWQEDVARTEERDRRREGRVRTRLQDKVEEEEKLKREVLWLIGTCEVGKAVSRMNSNGVASMSEPAVLHQMAAKYPAREQELPARVLKGEACSNLRGLREGLKALKRRRSPGSGGLRPEFLRVVGERMEAEHMSLLED
jgi:hypothetical protein